MSRAYRSFVAVAAGLMLCAAPALAQERVREQEKKAEPATSAEAIKRLQAELERVKAMEAELQAKMQQLKEAAAKAAAQGGNPFGGGGFGGGFGGFGGGNRGFGDGSRGGFGGPFGGLPVERMSAEQIKELIGHLQKVLEEKTRGEKPGAKPEKPAKPGKPDGEKRGVSQEEILKRLDKLSAEVEELKRSIKR